ncbi:NAD(P)-dependent oxidoreductase [Pelagicoccus mobilis]|uniref:D-isomer specific 2-hydroxyacid dehydrogenase NAD-binding domain-containing protein n=1 Tax=Pelagicoccus mobilis TaxID=415221 RepID=A0A934RWQ2_9BACT|nr:NAD(P)-dependent oxidoreductase [Pelagicoccus mobilis]MBK1875259.1 hypothetical protein [Pelagicoccus mobilis]
MVKDGLNQGFDANGSRKPRAAILGTRGNKFVRAMYSEAARRRISELFDLYPKCITEEDVVSDLIDVGEFEVLFATWGVPVLDSRQVAKFTRLKHIFFGAGSIKHFGLPFLEAGVTISSSKATNARIVADFCLGQILLATKRYFQNVAGYNSYQAGVELKEKLHDFPGHCGSRIGLIGCGKISRFLIGHLGERDFEISVMDPFLSDEESEKLGVRKVNLETLFEECDVVSNHLPNLPHLKGVLNGQLFSRMKQGATFMNTGRGAQIQESELLEVMQRRADLVALLDVTDPEPPEVDSKLYSQSNILLSSHIAGCVGREVHMLIDEAIESSRKWLKGDPLDNLESLEQFDLIA